MRNCYLSYILIIVLRYSDNIINLNVKLENLSTTLKKYYRDHAETVI